MHGTGIRALPRARLTRTRRTKSALSLQRSYGRISKLSWRPISIPNVCTIILYSIPYRFCTVGSLTAAARATQGCGQPPTDCARSIAYPSSRSIKRIIQSITQSGTRGKRGYPHGATLFDPMWTQRSWGASIFKASSRTCASVGMRWKNAAAFGVCARTGKSVLCACAHWAKRTRRMLSSSASSVSDGRRARPSRSSRKAYSVFGYMATIISPRSHGKACVRSTISIAGNYRKRVGNSQVILRMCCARIFAILKRWISSSASYSDTR